MTLWSGENRLFQISKSESRFLLFPLMLLLTAQAIECSPQLRNTFKLCSRSDPALDKCLVDSLNSARTTLAKGVPALGLAPLSALPVREIFVEEGPGELLLRFSVHNATWTGIDDYVVTRAKVDLKRPYIEFQTSIPKTLIRGPYMFGGRLLTLRINGEGMGDIEFGGLNVTHRIDLKEETRNGVVYWKATEYLWDMDVKSVIVNFQNLFKGNRRLGTYANQFINGNWRIIVQVYKQAIMEGFGTPLEDYVNILLAKVPLSQLFLP